MSHYRLPPKKAFCHEVTYKKIIGEDDWGKPIEETTVIKPVWFNRATLFSRSGNNATAEAPRASITIPFKFVLTEIPAFKTGDKITFEDEEYTVLLSKPLYLEGKLIGHRLEVK